MKLEDRWMVARRGERLAERKNEGKKKRRSGGGGKGNTDIRRRKGSGGWSSGAYTANTYTTGTSMYVCTHVRVHIHGRGCGGSRVCTRIRARASYVRSFYYPRTAGSLVLCCTTLAAIIGASRVELIWMFFERHGPGAFVSQEAPSTISPNLTAATAAFLNPPPPHPPLSAPPRSATAPTARKYTPILRPCYPRIPQFIFPCTDPRESRFIGRRRECLRLRARSPDGIPADGTASWLPPLDSSTE